MKKKTLHLWDRLLFASVLLALLSSPFFANAQLTRNYATNAIAHSNGGGLIPTTFDVPDFANASDGILATSATLQAQTVLLGLLSQKSSFAEVGFSADVPDGATIYVPVQDDTAQGLLSVLAGGTLGNLVTGLLGNQRIEVAIKNNAGTVVVNYNSGGVGTRVFSQGRFNFVKDASGQSYITFRASAGISYSRIRVSVFTGGLVASSYTLKMQDAFYLSGAYDPCNPFVTTSYDATGATLGVLTGTDGLPVKNTQLAIDNDTATASTFGYGVATVALGSTFSQSIHYSNLSKPGDQVKLRLRFPQSLLSANVLNTMTIDAYRHDTLVSSSSFSGLLNAQLLALITLNLGNNIPAVFQLKVDTSAAQNMQYDEIRVTYQQLANISVSQFIELYGVERVPPAPIVPVPPVTSCPGTAMHLAVANVKAGTNYKWYNDAGTVVSTDTAYNMTVPANNVTVNFYVTTSTCPGVESARIPVAVTGTNGNCVSFSPIAYLQGTFDGNRNRDVTATWAAILAANATSQPYNVPPFNYPGTETVSPAIFTSTLANNDIVDWMLLELKDAAGNLVDRKAVFVLENGNLANLDKTQPVVMKALSGSYFLTIRHRNHLALSSNLTPYVAGDNLFDFTSATDATLFGDANAFITLNGHTAMRGGNANSNSNTRFNGATNDRDVILQYLGGNEASTIFNVYTPVDVNLDGNVRFNGSGNDRDALLLNLGGSEFITIFEQKK
nr:hypothetical protein [Taibaiella koreensis]